MPLCGVLLALALGCSASGDSGGDRSGSSGASAFNSGSSGAGDAVAGAAGTAFDNPSDAIMSGGPSAAGGADAPVVEEPTCGATSVAAEQIVVEEQVEVEEVVEEVVEDIVEEEVTTVAPIAIYIMLDQSFSMVPLWLGAVTGINNFVGDARSDGIDVALDFFPPLLGDTGACDGTGYDVPYVPLGRLPAYASQITSTLNALPLPTGIGTPTEGGLRGATRFCADFQAANPDEKCVAVLVTDGAPSGCDEVHDDLVNIVSQAQAGGVMTFAVGLFGADFNLLNRIAMAGGGDDCDPGAQYACDVSSDSNGLVDALQRIRDTVVTVETHTETHVVPRTVTHTETVTRTVETPLECEWQIPAPDSDQGVDFDKVNVVLTASDLDDTPLGKVDSMSDCAANGWFYDDPEAPTRVIACDETCGVIQASTGAQVDILLGCPTIPLE